MRGAGRRSQPLRPPRPGLALTAAPQARGCQAAVNEVPAGAEPAAFGGPDPLISQQLDGLDDLRRVFKNIFIF